MSPELAGWGWSPVRCPRCSQENPDEARFCLHCGAQLSYFVPRLRRGAAAGRQVLPGMWARGWRGAGSGELHPGAYQ